MLYTAKTSNYTMYESTDNSNDMNGEMSEPIVHTWKQGKQYNIDIDEINDAITIESEAGTCQPMSAVSIDKELMERTFGIDISPLVNKALERNKEALKAEYVAAGNPDVVI